MSESTGVVVPAYRPNVETLESFVRSLHRTLSPAAIRVELDAPLPGVERTLADLPATVHAVSERRGKGAAITFGFERLDTDILAFADADGATPAESVARVVESLDDGRADLSVGSRRHPDAQVRSHQTRARRRLGDGFAWLARCCIDPDLHDYQCGAKAITREAWEAVRGDLYRPGFAWDVELVGMAGVHGCRIVEVPVAWHDQPGSTVPPLRTAAELLTALVGIRRRAADARDRPALTATRPRKPALVDRLAASEGDD